MLGRISVMLMLRKIFAISALLYAYGFRIPLLNKRINHNYSQQLFVTSSTTGLQSSSLMSDIAVMVNGMPGLMALETAKSCIDNGLNLLPLGFTGEKTEIDSIVVEGRSKSVTVQLIKGPGTPASVAPKTLQTLKLKYPKLIVVDYTHPTAILSNVECYISSDCDFVMGTTGGDPAKVMELFNRGEVTAVIAPNMAKQIVAVQAALLDMSQRYPNSFKNYKLTVTESHQSGKADTSGTAKALVAYLSDLTGAPFSFGEIIKLRDRESQLIFGVPEYSLDGHAFHTYRLTSEDDSVAFELKHNVCGRRVYADGTVDAVVFVHRLNTDAAFAEAVRGEQINKRLFNMIDVLESEKVKI